MSTPASTSHLNGTASPGEGYVALCTGATGVSSVHLLRHLHEDSRFKKAYGVSRRDLYDLPEAIEHIKLDLLDAEAVKNQLKSKGIKAGA